MKLLFLRPSYSLAATFLLIFCISQTSVQATDYVVGGLDGWKTGIDYVKWSKQYNFSVGDVLVFNYAVPTHDLYQVTKPAFLLCNASSGGDVINTHNSGADRIPLTANTTDYYFICTKDGHCLTGMRLTISLNTSSPASSMPPPTPPPTAPPTPSYGYRLSAGGGWWIGGTWMVGLALGALFSVL